MIERLGIVLAKPWPQDSSKPRLETETDHALKNSSDLMCQTFPLYQLTVSGKTAKLLAPWSVT